MLLAVDGPVATITFNRPEKLNAADLAQCHALEAAVAAVGVEPGVRVVLLRGAGRSFGTGIDRDMVADGVPAERFADGVDELVARYTALSPAAVVVAVKRLTGRAFDAPRDTVLAEALPLLADCLAQGHVAAVGAAWRSR